MQSLETIWKRSTPHFTVIVDAVEEADPDLSWDESGETASAIAAGRLVLFCARARVLIDGMGTVGYEYLGNCVYKDFADFKKPRGFMQDMVHNVIATARSNLLQLQQIRVRAAA